MNAYRFISALDDARHGKRRMAEDQDAVGKSPSHAPTSTAQWKTPSSGKSEDEGERMGGEKDAIKMSKQSIPAPVAKAPSHAPTSGKDYTTTGKGGSEDEGEKVNKEAVKENLINALIDNDETDVAAILGETELHERGAHKAGCTCGFCKNKGSFGKKKDGEEKDEDDDDGDMSEAIHHPHPMAQPRQRMGFRHPSAVRPRPKAINAPGQAPYQPSMESRKGAKGRSIEEVADSLLEAPE